MRIFDLHCDTAYEMYRQKKDFNSDLQISAHNIKEYENYTQNFAFFCDNTLPDNECYRIFFKARDYLFSISDSAPENLFYILSVEDARLLSGDITRLNTLAACGVKILTLLWGGTTCIGGSHNTFGGLSELGRSTVEKCFELGIIPDVSHSSVKSFYDVAEISDRFKLPFIATHSDSYEICPHTRNLDDRQFEVIAEHDGIVGISMVPEHLCPDGNATSDDVIRHIEHYMSIGGEKTVCLGCDFDGIEKTPTDIEHAGNLRVIAEKLQKLNYTDEQIDRIFYSNADTFFRKNNVYPTKIHI